MKLILTIKHIKMNIEQKHILVQFVIVKYIYVLNINMNIHKNTKHNLKSVNVSESIETTPDTNTDTQ